MIAVNPICAAQLA